MFQCRVCQSVTNGGVVSLGSVQLHILLPTVPFWGLAAGPCSAWHVEKPTLKSTTRIWNTVIIIYYLRFIFSQCINHYFFTGFFWHNLRTTFIFYSVKTFSQKCISLYYYSDEYMDTVAHFKYFFIKINICGFTQMTLITFFSKVSHCLARSHVSLKRMKALTSVCRGCLCHE